VTKWTPSSKEKGPQICGHVRNAGNEYGKNYRCSQTALLIFVFNLQLRVLRKSLYFFKTEKELRVTIAGF